MARLMNIFRAVDTGNLENVQRNIEKGIDINVLNKERFTPLLCAIYDKNKSLIQLLIKLGADVNGNRKAYAYPLEMAMLSDYLEAAYILDETGKVKYNRNSDCSLSYAASKGKYEL